MNDRNRAFVKLLWRWVLVYPLVMIWGVDLMVSAALRRDMSLAVEWLPKLFQSAIAMLPFVALAVCAQVLLEKGDRHTPDRHTLDGLKFAALSVTVASILLWCAYYWDGIVAYTQRSVGGASIGLGILVLLSPILLSLLIPVAYLIGVRLSKA